MQHEPRLKIFRLLNGDDIIGYLEEFDPKDLAAIDEEGAITYEDLIFVRDPMRMVWSYAPDAGTNGGGGHQLYLTRWMAFSDDSLFAIPRDKVVTIAEPLDTVSEHYLSVYDANYETNIPTLIEQHLTKEERQQALIKREYMEFLAGWEASDKKKPH